MLGISRRSVCAIFRQRQNVAAVFSSSSSLLNASQGGDICGEFKSGRYSSITNFNSSNVFFMSRRFESTASGGNHTPNISDPDHKKEVILRKFSDMSSIFDDYSQKITHRNDELKKLNATFKGPQYSFQIFRLTFSWDFGWIRRKFLELEELENIREVLKEDARWIKDFHKTFEDFLGSMDDADSKHFEEEEEVIKTFRKSRKDVYNVLKEYSASMECLFDAWKWSCMWLLVRELMGVLSIVLLIIIIAHAYATQFV